MTTSNATSGVNDFSRADAVDELVKGWTTEDDVLSSPELDENENSDEFEDVSEDDVLSDEADEDETVETETDESEDDSEGEDDVPEAKYADDTDKIKYKFNGEELEISVGEIKRLAGQEQAMHHRMKDMVAAEKKVNDSLDRAEYAGEEMYARSLTRYNETWQGYDWARAFKDLPSTDFNRLRAVHDQDHNEVRYFGETLDKVVAEKRQVTEQAQAREFQERSAQVSKEIADPNTGIPDYSDTKMVDIGRYVMDNGVPQDRLPDLFHTPLLKMFEKARLYDMGQKVKTTPVVKTPKKITKQKVNVETTRGASNGNSAYKKAMDSLSAGGGREAAIQAMMAGWQDD